MREKNEVAIVSVYDALFLKKNMEVPRVCVVHGVFFCFCIVHNFGITETWEVGLKHRRFRRLA